MGWREIEERFQRMRREGYTGLIPFLTVGFPSLSATVGIALALQEAGADLLELGVPFSDPLADGPTIQRASHIALAGGVTLGLCLETCARLRERGLNIPVLLMGYYNPLLRYGLERTAREAARAGVDGFIVADLPPEEAGPFASACLAEGLCLVPLLAPTSTGERIARACRGAHGFVYCVSLTGVTGARQELPPGVAHLVGRVRRHTPLGIAVGFGVSRREHVQAIGRWAEAAVVGSALLQALEGADGAQAPHRARAFLEGLRAPEHLPGGAL